MQPGLERLGSRRSYGLQEDKFLDDNTRKKRPFDRLAKFFFKQLKFANFFFGKLSRFFDYINRNALLKQILCDFTGFLKATTVLPVGLFNISHHRANHISSTKITQFHFVLQDLEYGAKNELKKTFYTSISVATRQLSLVWPEPTKSMSCDLFQSVLAFA